jgi:hypothetical protein
MTSDSTIDVKRQETGPARGGRFVSRLAGLAAGAGGVAVFAVVSQASSWAEYARAVAGLLMVAGCAWAAGALVGFLFGLPRTLSSPPDEPSVFGARGDEFVHYRVNTNLEQISDWLTKILVGVGLAEFHQLPAAVRGAADYFAASVGGRAASDLSGFVVALLVYFSIVGLMTGYLGTRVLLAPLFKLADKRLPAGSTVP